MGKAPEGADSHLRVGEGMISNDSQYGNTARSGEEPCPRRRLRHGHDRDRRRNNRCSLHPRQRHLPSILQVRQYVTHPGDLTGLR